MMVTGPLTFIWSVWFLYEVYSTFGMFDMPFLGKIDTVGGAITVGAVAIATCAVIVVVI